MANEHVDLKAKIDEEPLNAGRTDQQVLDWLVELETGPWVDVGASEFARWAAAWKLPGRLFAARNITPASDEQSGSHMLHQSWTRREGLETGNDDIRAHLADAVGNPVTLTAPVSTAARDDLLDAARPDAPRWVNASWTHAPILGDVVAARALP